MGGHLADDVGIVVDAGSAGIGGPSVGLGGSPGREILGDEGMQSRPNSLTLRRAECGRVQRRRPAPRRRRRSASCPDGCVLLRRSRGHACCGCRISVSSTSTRPASALRPGTPVLAQLGAQQPRRLVGAESELALQLQRRDAVEWAGAGSPPRTADRGSAAARSGA